MEISVIASGSNGNCTLVEHKGTSVIIDAGKSCKEIERRLNSIGKSLENIDAILMTHSHTDHSQSCNMISRKYDVPIYAKKETAKEMPGGDEKNIKAFTKTFRIKDIDVYPIETSHDVPSCGFRIGRFAIITDTGAITKEMDCAMKKIETLLIESNYDESMLKSGPYPWFLKKRIMSECGHLSNKTASEFVKENQNNISLCLLGHLSGNNNTPKIAKETFESIVPKKIDHPVCSRDDLTGSWTVPYQ